MKPRLAILLAFGLLCLKVSARQNDTLATNEKMKAAAIAKVRQLPEVKEFLKSPENPEHKRDLKIDNVPHDNFKYYVVKMGYDHDYTFFTLKRFCVDPRTMKVYFWDIMADDAGFSTSAIITLSQWRSLRKTAAWQERHTYKNGKLIVLKN